MLVSSTNYQQSKLVNFPADIVSRHQTESPKGFRASQIEKSSWQLELFVVLPAANIQNRERGVKGRGLELRNN